MRLRDIAGCLDTPERSAFGIITDLIEARYVVKEKDGRRNGYHIQAHLPLSRPSARNVPAMVLWCRRPGAIGHAGRYRLRSVL